MDLNSDKTWPQLACNGKRARPRMAGLPLHLAVTVTLRSTAFRWQRFFGGRELPTRPIQPGWDCIRKRDPRSVQAQWSECAPVMLDRPDQPKQQRQPRERHFARISTLLGLADGPALRKTRAVKAMAVTGAIGYRCVGSSLQRTRADHAPSEEGSHEVPTHRRLADWSALLV